MSKLVRQQRMVGVALGGIGLLLVIGGIVLMYRPPGGFHNYGQLPTALMTIGSWWLGMGIGLFVTTPSKAFQMGIIFMCIGYLLPAIAYWTAICVF